MTMISKHCPKCDGQEIYQNSYWTWDIKKQDWRCDDDDTIHCPSCGYSGYKTVDKKIEHESLATEHESLATEGEPQNA
jgi:uncharacterized Zn finger protein (UPF0148 family)